MVLVFFAVFFNFAIAAVGSVGDDPTAYSCWGNICGWSLSNISNFGLPQATISNILISIVSWLLTIFWVISVGAFMVSGIMYLVSAGNEEAVTKAKKYMLYSIVGVIVGLSGYVIVRAVSLMLQASSPF